MFQPKMSALFSLLGLGGLYLATSTNLALATPIPFQGGMLDGSFIVYDLIYPGDGAAPDLTVRHSYQIGIDFGTGIPDAYLDKLNPQPYHASAIIKSQSFIHPALALTDPASPDPTFDFFARTYGWFNFSVDFIGGQPVHIPGRPLADACDGSTIPVGFSNPNFSSGLIAARGNCFFDKKWTNIENANYDAGIIVNNNPGNVFGFSGISSPHTIPFILVTQDVGRDLQEGSEYQFKGTELKGMDAPVFSIEISWTPDPISTPEPAAMAVLGVGLLGLLLRRRNSGDVLLNP